MSVTLKRIDVVVLFVANLDRSKAFYRDTFGLQMKYEDQDSAAFDFESISLLLLSVAGAQDLLSSEAVALRRPGSSFELVAFVENVDATYTDLVAQGVEFVREPTDRSWGLRTAHFKDPDGNIWEIAQPLSKDSDEG